MSEAARFCWATVCLPMCWSVVEQDSLSAPSAGTHQLPALPYDYNALEPVIDEATLRLHHDKHHAGYVNGLNRTELKIAAATPNPESVAIKLTALSPTTTAANLDA